MLTQQKLEQRTWKMVVDSYNLYKITFQICMMLTEKREISPIMF